MKKKRVVKKKKKSPSKKDQQDGAGLGQSLAQQEGDDYRQMLTADQNRGAGQFSVNARIAQTKSPNTGSQNRSSGLKQSSKQQKQY